MQVARWVDFSPESLGASDGPKLGYLTRAGVCAIEKSEVRSSLAIAACLLALVVPRAALCSEPSDTDNRPHRLTWRPEYRDSNAVDYAFTAAAFAGTLTLAIAVHPSAGPHWDQPILFDESARSFLGASPKGERTTLALISNLTQYGGIAHVAFDAIGVGLVGDHNPHVARELLWMDAEAYAVALLFNNLTKRLVLRARPLSENCRRDPNYDSYCGTTEEKYSFYSGHSTIGGTSAGLICAEHQYLSLYGGASDPLACVGALLTMSATGVLRIASDQHWASDVIAGHLIGFATGYGLPALFHFRAGAPRRASASRGFGVQVVPISSGRDFALSAVGRF